MKETDYKENNTENNIENVSKVGNASFGIPSDCTKKQKFNGIKLMCYIVVVTIACGLIYSGYRYLTEYFLPEMTFDKSVQPVLYVLNDTLKVKSDRDKIDMSLVSSDSFSGDEAEKYVKTTDNGKYVFYGINVAEESSVSDEGFDLYVSDVSSSGGKDKAFAEAKFIARGVTDFKIHPEGQFVVYLKGSRLCFSDIQDAHVIAEDVREFYLSDNNQQIVFYKDGGMMYTCAIGEGDVPVLVDKGIDKVLSEKNEYNSIYYIKQGMLFQKESGKKSLCVAENIKDGIMLGRYVYFVREEVRTKPFKDVFSDDLKKSDNNISPELEKADYTVYDENGNAVFDKEAYSKAVKNYEEKLVRDSVRNHFVLNPMTETVNVLYVVKGGKYREVDTHISDKSLSYNSCLEAIVYEKTVDAKKKIPISSVDSTENAILLAEDFLNGEKAHVICLLEQDKQPYVAFDNNDVRNIEISLDRKFLYCIEDLNDEGKGYLVRYNLGSRELKNRTVLKKDITDFYLDGTDSSVLAVFEGNKLGIITGDSYTHLSDNSCHDFFYVDGTFFFFDEYDFGRETGKLKTFRDGKIRKVDVGVHAFDVRNMKTVSYIKHYNKELGVGDLYLKSGKSQGKRLDACVRYILN